MSLKSKVILILICLFGLYGIIDYNIQSLIVYPRFKALEESQARDNLRRAVHAIKREIEHLDSVCHDWSSWDDMYHFTKSRSEEYVESNLADSTFEDLEINLLYICDLNGRGVWSKIYDLDSRKAIDLENFPRDGLAAGHPLLQLNMQNADLANVSLSGVIDTEKGPMLVASRPVLLSGNIGPSRGFLIMGKFLTDNFAARLSEQTRVEFSISGDTAAAGALLKDTPFSLDSGFPYATEYTDKDRLTVLTAYPDITGKAAFLIKSTMARDIIRHGREAMRYTLFTLAVIGLLIVAIVLFLIQRTILHPVTNLTKHVLSISRTGNFSVRLSVKRQDEIGALAREFDRMLEKIEDMNTVMERINDQLVEDISKRQEIETKLQEANKELHRLAMVDGLTQLSNRRRFDEYIDIEWKRGIRENTPLSLIIFDVDFFKLYNDTYGHQAGDDCLRAIAGTISRNVKRVADFAARYGGEEFALVLPATDIKGALHLAETIRTEIYGLEIPHSKSLLDGRVTISAGVACIVPRKGLTLENLIKLADEALYNAKAQGRNMSVTLQENEPAMAGGSNPGL